MFQNSVTVAPSTLYYYAQGDDFLEFLVVLEPHGLHLFRYLISCYHRTMLLAFLHAIGLHLLLTEAVDVAVKNHNIQCNPQGPKLKSFESDCHVILEYFQGSPTHRIKNVYTSPNVFVWNTCRFEVQLYLETESQPLRDVALAGSIFLQIYHECVRQRSRNGGLFSGTPSTNRNFNSFRGFLIEQAPLPYSNTPDSDDDEHVALLGERPDSSTEASDVQWTFDPAGDSSGPDPSNGDNANDVVIEVADSTDSPASSAKQGNISTTITSFATATASACPNWAARICCWENDRVWERLNPVQYAGTLVTGVCSAALGAFITWRVNNPGAAAKLAEACLDATQKGLQMKGCV